MRHPPDGGQAELGCILGKVDALSLHHEAKQTRCTLSDKWPGAARRFVGVVSLGRWNGGAGALSGPPATS